MTRPTFRPKLFKPAVYNGVTLFFVPAFKSKHWHYRPVIRGLLRQGFQIYVYDYTWRPLLTCPPEEWLPFTESMTKDIGHKIKYQQAAHPGCKFAIIGASVGSTLALHAAKRHPELERMMFVTLYGSSAQLVWENKTLRKVKKKFVSSNRTMQDAIAVFGPMEATENLELLGQRPILLFANMDDKVIRYSNTFKFLHAANEQNLNLMHRLVLSSRHSLTLAKVFGNAQLWLPFLLEMCEPDYAELNQTSDIPNSHKVSRHPRHRHVTS